MPDDVRSRLTAPADGLLFISESESPFEYVDAGRAHAGPPGAREVMEAFGEEDVPSREVSVVAFFAGHIDDADPSDPVAQAQVPRFRALVNAVQSVLDAPRVYCFGDVEKRCYVVGGAGERIAGLRVTVFES